MQSRDFSDLYDLESTMWWFVGMREITKALLDVELTGPSSRLILDAGCGTGANLEFLRRYSNGGGVIGIDISRDALAYCALDGNGSLVESSAVDLPFASETFDVVTSFDVIVQIPGKDSAKRALREMFRVLRPGGTAFVRSAAYEWMRAGHDAAMQTQRRYTLSALKQELTTEGFDVVKATYANCGLFPIAVAKRQILEPLHIAKKSSDVKPFPSGLQWMDPIFRTILLAEAAILKSTRFRFPFGLSAICVARKPLESDQILH